MKPKFILNVTNLKIQSHSLVKLVCLGQLVTLV